MMAKSSKIGPVIALCAVFIFGFGFGKLHSIVLKLFPSLGAGLVQSSYNDEPVIPDNLSFAWPAIDPSNLEQTRKALWSKMYGAGGRPEEPTRRALTVGALKRTYLTEKIYDRFYRQLFETRSISVTEIRGRFSEIEGYEWKTLFFKNDREVNQRLFILHHGHGGGDFQFERLNAVASRLIDTGYDVIVVSMPGIGWNQIENVRVQTWDGWGYLAGTYSKNHELFELIDTGDGHFIKFFLDPVIASIDAAHSLGQYRHTLMAGASGGGWTTTLAAALDDRIDYSFSFSGTLPFFARHNARDFGDAEQYDASFYRDFPYTTLYELASAAEGKHRIHYQVFNTRDYCCFRETSVASLRKYHERRQSPADWDFRLMVVDSGTHGYTPEVFAKVLNEVESHIQRKSGVALDEATHAR